jgi:signal transduction histidine kinase
MTPPAGRLYWICQAAGWGSFLAYVLIAYLATNPVYRPWDVASIIFFNGVVCPVVTHRLRAWMHANGWMQLPARRLWWRCAAFAVVAAFALTGAVAIGIVATRSAPSPVPVQALAGIFAGFLWAFAGWLTIYYVVHVRRRRDALQIELQMAAHEAELRALRAQINPHFLFNCLNSLRHLIGVSPDRAQAMVTSLADLLRYSLDADRRDLAPLSAELRMVDEYLGLERVRFEERLRVERAVDPAALTVLVPTMLLQSLVDNAIKHGIAELVQGGVVRIEATVTHAELTLRVRNTGALKPPADRAGQGLQNARDRLRLLYDGAASLSLSNADGMTEALVRIPVIARAAAEPA